MLKFLVSGQKIETVEREVIASDQIAFVNIHFVFEGDWKQFHKVVQFTQCSSTYCRVLGTDGLSCLLPSELHAGAVKMSVFGYDEENTAGLRAITVPVTLNIRQSGFVGDDPPIPPTPDLYAQLLQKINENGGANGKDDKDGVDGKNGLNGKDGADGKSAYEIAVDNGFNGTLSDWLASLKGADGKDGINGKRKKPVRTAEVILYHVPELVAHTAFRGRCKALEKEYMIKCSAGVELYVGAYLLWQKSLL